MEIDPFSSANSQKTDPSSSSNPTEKPKGLTTRLTEVYMRFTGRAPTERTESSSLSEKELQEIPELKGVNLPHQSIMKIASDYLSVKESLNEEERQFFFESRLHQEGIKPQWIRRKIEESPRDSPIIARGVLPRASSLCYKYEEDDKRSARSIKKRAEPMKSARDDENFQRIVNASLREGKRVENPLMAHGTKEVSTLIDILVDGHVYCQFFGGLTDGPGQRDTAAGPHGPFYLVFKDEEKDITPDKSSKGVSIEQFQAVLVRPQDKEKVLYALGKAHEKKFIPTERYNFLLSLVKDYKEFADELNL